MVLTSCIDLKYSRCSNLNSFFKPFPKFYFAIVFPNMRNEINSNSEKCLIGRLSTLIFRLNHKNSDKIIAGTAEAERIQVLQN